MPIVDRLVLAAASRLLPRIRWRSFVSGAIHEHAVAA